MSQECFLHILVGQRGEFIHGGVFGGDVCEFWRGRVGEEVLLGGKRGEFSNLSSFRLINSFAVDSRYRTDEHDPFEPIFHRD